MKTSPPPSTHPAGKHASLLSRDGVSQWVRGGHRQDDNRKQTKWEGRLLGEPLTEVWERLPLDAGDPTGMSEGILPW